MESIRVEHNKGHPVEFEDVTNWTEGRLSISTLLWVDSRGLVFSITYRINRTPVTLETLNPLCRSSNEYCRTVQLSKPFSISDSHV